MLGLGTASIITGAMILGETKNFQDTDNINNGGGLLFLGFLIDLGSIPFFIAASNNKEKAMSVAIINEPIPKEMIAHVKQNSIPALSVKWKF